MNILALDCSEHTGSTYDMFKMESQNGADMSAVKNSVEFRSVPQLRSCINCSSKKCGEGHCVLKDDDVLEEIYNSIMNSDVVYFYSPVYCNMATARFWALMSRFSSYNINRFDREMFSGKKAYIRVIADVSGTQMAAAAMMSALNMLGFELPSRCVKEFIHNWQDKKVRGGSLSDVFYMPNQEFRTKSEL